MPVLCRVLIECRKTGQADLLRNELEPSGNMTKEGALNFGNLFEYSTTVTDDLGFRGRVGVTVAEAVQRESS